MYESPGSSACSSCTAPAVNRADPENGPSTRRGRPDASSTRELAPASFTRWVTGGAPAEPSPGSSVMTLPTTGTSSSPADETVGSASTKDAPSKSSSTTARSGRLLSDETVRATRGVDGQSSAP